MPPIEQLPLSRRERQIMDIILEIGECSAHDVVDRLPDPPSYSAVRALLARMLEKKLVIYRMEGNKHIYSARLGEKKAQESAMKRLLKTFFRGSRVNAVAALLDVDGQNLSEHEIADLQRTIDRLKAQKNSSKNSGENE